MAEQQERKIQPLPPHGLHAAEYKRTAHFTIAPRGTQPEDLLDPGFWAHVAATLKPRDRIEVHAEDGTWFCEVLVLDTSRAYARVKPFIGPVSLTTADVAQTQLVGFEVSFRGAKKWGVIRTADRAVMLENEQTRDGAEKWLKDNAGKLAA